MPKSTPNYNLEKPNQDDFYNVDVQNKNMDKIDTTLKVLDNKIADGVTHEDLNAIDVKLDDINSKSDQIKQNTETIKTTTNSTKIVVDNTKTTVDSTKTKVDAIDTRTSTMNTNINTLLNGRVVKSVQRGTTLMPQGGNSVTINFSSVDIGKCSVDFKGTEVIYVSSFTSTSMKLSVSNEGTMYAPTYLSWEVTEYY
ncbi:MULTISPECIES: hypothetical protein [unclassified Lysinibacillus]|uniref:hypothetical protein n=1 Tax=unclassified Lysinibacillus TaxID=2636778 RepID=UPI003816C38A